MTHRRAASPLSTLATHQHNSKMKRFFLFFSYDYYENGGVGFEQFDTKQEALDHINNHLKGLLGDEVPLSSWRLIEGRELDLMVVKRITEVTA